MSKLETIQAFISVVEQNGFAAAARKHQVSTAAISRQISRLEAELKTQLLRRTTRKLTLTETGQDYYQHVKKTLDDLSQAEMMIRHSHTEAMGILRITSNRYYAINSLLPRLPEFMAQNPQLKVKVEFAERFPNLLEESLDIVFGMSIENDLDLVRKPIGSTHYVLCASPEYLEKFGKPKTIEDLVQHRYITHSERHAHNTIRFKDDKVIYVEPFLAINDSFAMRECALKNMGIVKLHHYMVAGSLASGKLIELFPELRETEKTIYLYYRQNRYLEPKIRKFVEFYSKKYEARK